jgi:hypothetical protein
LVLGWLLLLLLQTCKAAIFSSLVWLDFLLLSATRVPAKLPHTD